MQKITQILLVKPDFNSFPLIPNSVSYFVSGFQKYTCKLLTSASFYFFIIVPIVHLFSFPHHAVFLNWLCNHWSGSFRLTYTPVDGKTLVKQCFTRRYIWKKNNYNFNLLLHSIVVSKRVDTVSLLILERLSPHW